jgi:hypothetical protein
MHGHMDVKWERCVLSIQHNTEPQGDPSKTVLHSCKAITLMTYSYIVYCIWTNSTSSGICNQRWMYGIINEMNEWIN